MSHAPTRNEGVTTFSWVTGIAKSDGAGLELKFGAQTAFVSKAVLMSPTEFVRMAIIDKYGDSGSQNALKAFHCLSEDQCRALVKDQDKLNAWLASKFLLYKEEGETKIQQDVSCHSARTRRASLPASLHFPNVFSITAEQQMHKHFAINEIKGRIFPLIPMSTIAFPRDDVRIRHQRQQYCPLVS